MTFDGSDTINRVKKIASARFLKTANIFSVSALLVVRKITSDNLTFLFLDGLYLSKSQDLRSKPKAIPAGNLSLQDSHGQITSSESIAIVNFSS